MKRAHSTGRDCQGQTNATSKECFCRQREGPRSTRGRSELPTGARRRASRSGPALISGNRSCPHREVRMVSPAMLLSVCIFALPRLAPRLSPVVGASSFLPSYKCVSEPPWPGRDPRPFVHGRSVGLHRRRAVRDWPSRSLAKARLGRRHTSDLALDLQTEVLLRGRGRLEKMP